MGRVYSLSDDRGQFSAFNHLPGWEYHKNMMGLPHVFLKTTKKKKHSSFSVTFTGQKIVLKEDKLKKKLEGYTQGRKEWAKKKKVKIKKFHKYEFTQTKQKMRIHIIGFDYSTPFLKNIKEKSIYLNCPDDSIIHFKAVLLPEHHKDETELINFIKSVMTCKLNQI